MSFCCREWPNCHGCPKLLQAQSQTGGLERKKKEQECSDAPTTDVGFGQT